MIIIKMWLCFWIIVRYGFIYIQIFWTSKSLDLYTSTPPPTFAANPFTFLPPSHNLLGWVLSINPAPFAPICTPLECNGSHRNSKHEGSHNTLGWRSGNGNTPCRVFIAPWLVLCSHTCSKLCSSGLLVHVNAFDVVTRGCGNPINPFFLVFVFLETIKL